MAFINSHDTEGQSNSTTWKVVCARVDKGPLAISDIASNPEHISYQPKYRFVPAEAACVGCFSVDRGELVMVVSDLSLHYDFQNNLIFLQHH